MKARLTALAMAMLFACGSNVGPGIADMYSVDPGPDSPHSDREEQLQDVFADSPGEAGYPDNEDRVDDNGGCGPDCGDSFPEMECKEDAGCVQPPCASTKDCPDLLVCLLPEGACVECTADEDCDGDLFCLPDHTCGQAHPCDSDKDCKGYGLLCDKGTGQCVECNLSADCPVERFCSSSICLPDLCVPEDTHCEGPNVLVCAADGSGSLLKETCAGGEHCEDGQCVAEGKICTAENVQNCPSLPDYTVSCNQKQHCEYANQDTSGWKKWDVWIWIPPGTFQMGSPDNEEGRSVSEGPVHEVTFAKGYFIGKYEIVVEQFDACQFVSKCPKLYEPGDLWGLNTIVGRWWHPQNSMNPEQALAFCEWVAPAGRLPSEAEWEYAAAGPIHTKYPWGDTPEPTCFNNTALFDGDGIKGKPWACAQDEYTGGTVPVGGKTGGAAWCGALDMSGNVGEWVQDAWSDSYVGAPADGSAWIFSSGHGVLRGGNYSSLWFDVRTGSREQHAPSDLDSYTGARCVRTN